MAAHIWKRRRGLYFVIGILIILFISFSSIISFIVDYQWFNEVDYINVFLAKIINQLKIGVPLFILLAVLLYLYMTYMKKDFLKHSHIILDNSERKRINRVISIVSVIVSFLVSIVISRGLWLNILQYVSASRFNISDPIFQKDISFYAFKLPLLREVLSILVFLVIILVVMAILFYGAMITLKAPLMMRDRLNNEQPPGRASLLNKQILNLAIRQIATIGFVLFIILALRYYIGRYDLLFSPRGVAYGASYTDIVVTLKVYWLQTGVSILSAVLIVYAAFSRKYKIALYGPALLIAVTILGNIAAVAVQNFIVEPNEFAREQPFLKHNIEYTKKAYNLDKIKEEVFRADQDLNIDQLQQNRSTIENIRIHDYRPVKQAYNQLQSIRFYYQFNDIDIDRYLIDDVYTQVFLSARELPKENLREEAKTWINKYLRYTHGYGAVVSPVNRVTPQGQPQFSVKDIPPVTDTNLKIDRPEIYFGELTNDYIITNTKTPEFDYPMGDDNKGTYYEGSAGISTGLLNKIVFALYNRSAKILLSTDVTRDSRMIINRNIVQRVKKVAPFFMYDDDPYLVIDNGQLYWIIDGYTYNTYYPYSQPIAERINYIRNSFKVVIDAYNGTITYYLIEPDDPVAGTYAKIFPDLFTSFEDMPDGLKQHIRYPQTLFDIQASMYRDYHMENPQVFYNREDAWNIAQEQFSDNVEEMESNYLVFKLPGEDKVEFLLTIPYTPAKRNNMISFMVARNDGGHYGEMIVYKLPKSRLIYGPLQIESRISQDPVISRELSLWDQRGSDVIRGNLITIPIDSSLLYVEPLYIQASNENSLPEMKRVIVAYEDIIVMENTLEIALERIFGEAPPEVGEDEGIVPVPGDQEEVSLEELVSTANELFINAQEASQRGDWAKYGEYLNQLKDVLKRLQKTYPLPAEQE